jgi:hypothetical protein
MCIYFTLVGQPKMRQVKLLVTFLVKTLDICEQTV